MYLCLFLSVNVKPRYISWLPDCQTESVGGDIHRGAFSGTFMRDFFPWLKRRLTTHSKVASALCTHARVGLCVCVCAYEPVRSGALPLSAPTWAARGVFCFVFCFGEPSPVLRKCCRKQWELTPSSASVPLKKGSGLSGRREERGRGGGGEWRGLSAWVCHGHVGGCLHAHTHTNTHTQPQSRLV